MAKKKSSDGGAGALILGLIAIAIILAPLGILIYAIYLRLNKNEDFLNENGNIWLSFEEKQEFVAVYKEYSESANRINYAHHLAKRHNVSINKDGSYSRRSKVGKEINVILEREEPRYNRFKERLSELSVLPEKMYRKVIFNISFLTSAKYALASWVISFCIAYFMYGKQAMESSFYSGVISVGCMLAFFFFLKGGIKESLADKGIQEPPSVEINNVDLY